MKLSKKDEFEDYTEDYNEFDDFMWNSRQFIYIETAECYKPTNVPTINVS